MDLAGVLEQRRIIGEINANQGWLKEQPAQFYEQGRQFIRARSAKNIRARKPIGYRTGQEHGDNQTAFVRQCVRRALGQRCVCRNQYADMSIVGPMIASDYEAVSHLRASGQKHRGGKIIKREQFDPKVELVRCGICLIMRSRNVRHHRWASS
jgi:hypothetical protein